VACTEYSAPPLSHIGGFTHRVHILVVIKQGQCICPLSWSVHCNFSGEGKCSEKWWACQPPPLPARLILPSWWNVRQKAAVTTLCTLWVHHHPNIPPLPTSVALHNIFKGSGGGGFHIQLFPDYETTTFPSVSVVLIQELCSRARSFCAWPRWQAIGMLHPSPFSSPGDSGSSRISPGLLEKHCVWIAYLLSFKNSLSLTKIFVLTTETN
jgi:hypothetical protein